jgi:tRNA threonylcarbamoyladenosine biosynthesis protein TsaB
MILGIETATQICGVALCQDGKLVGEYRLNIKNVHAGMLIQYVRRLLADSRLKTADLDAIAVSIGPGSFTGLRIGLASAKGLAFAHEHPVVGVPTLQALASQAPVAQGLIAALLRSRAKEYYGALFERVDFTDRMLQPPEIITEEKLADFLPPQAMLIADPSCGTVSAPNSIAPPLFAYPSAFTIARLGETKWRAGVHEAADLLEPDYMQEFITGPPKAGLN